ncbi:hypothetical protein LEP1GSC133_1888 [Leptospira borgpetersenii serovar Pomona str. 200901868]|uniref:Uncharacterized protein n=1 Tax=Leptospira borgpetersenii serovar Pomona str. 200901868 TaxID=1192866 RepID=M6W013_LEPBO|nr:hypothetical protein LEP1GSC133_1888 [Leptospira borgpetersenii serovar Pomona str. 200901868]
MIRPNVSILRTCPKTLKKSTQSFHKFVIERVNSRRSV